MRAIKINTQQDTIMSHSTNRLNSSNYPINLTEWRRSSPTSIISLYLILRGPALQMKRNIQLSVQLYWYLFLVLASMCVLELKSLFCNGNSLLGYCGRGIFSHHDINPRLNEYSQDPCLQPLVQPYTV